MTEWLFESFRLLFRFIRFHSCSWSRCFTLLFAIFFFIYVVGAGTKEAETKKKALRPTSKVMVNTQQQQQQQQQQVQPPETPERNDDDAEADNKDWEKPQEEENREDEEPVQEDNPDDETKTDEADEAPEKERPNKPTPEQDEETLQTSISEAIMDFDETEQQSVNANLALLTDTVNHIHDTLKVGISRIFGANYDVTDAEMESMVQQVSHELQNQAQADFQRAADTLTYAKADEIEDVVDEDVGADMEVRTIQEDIKQVEEGAIEVLKKEIDQAALDVNGNMKKRVREIEQQVIAQAIANKQRHEYKKKPKTKCDAVIIEYCPKVFKQLRSLDEYEGEELF